MELELERELKIHQSVPCVSIVLPTQRTSPGRRVDPPRLKKIISNAKKLLKEKYGSVGEKIFPQLDHLNEEINFLENQAALGLYVSPNFTRIIRFDFPVDEKITVGEHFEIREVLQLKQQQIRYYFLSLSKKTIQLFKGHGKELKEVKNNDFPISITSTYNYQKPSRGSSYGNALKNTEGDKSIKEEKQLIAILRSADAKLKPYLEHDVPFIISGVPQLTGYFKKITHSKRDLMGIIDGNYSNRKGKDNPPFKQIDFELKAWQNQKEDEFLDALNDAFGKRRVAGGLEEVWHALKNGMGQTLVVEKDFHRAGFLSEATGNLSRRAPKEKHQILSDVVDYIILTAIEKNVNVKLIGHDKLYEHDRIALLLRYNKEVK